MMAFQTRWSFHISLFILPFILVMFLFFHSCSGRKEGEVGEDPGKSGALSEEIQKPSEGSGFEAKPEISESLPSLESLEFLEADLEREAFVSSQPSEKAAKKKEPIARQTEAPPKPRPSTLQEAKKPEVKEKMKQIPAKEIAEEETEVSLKEAEKAVEAPGALLERSPGEPYLLSGHTAFKREEYRDAIKYLKKAVEKDPNLFLAHYWLGRTYVEKGRHSSAVKAFENAIAARAEEDKDIDVETFLAREYVEDDQYDKAITLYREKIKKDPLDVENHFWLAFSLKGAGHLEEAAQAYRKAIEINPDMATVHFNLANTLEEMGNDEEAIEEYRAAIALNPDYGKAYFNLGVTLEEEDRLDKAIEAFNRCLELDHNSRQAKRHIKSILKKKE